MRCIDLHIHSSISDGTETPAQIVRKAKEANLAVIALTDHDTTAGLSEAAEEAEALDITFVPGCEISTRTEQRSIHILGLWLPLKDESLEKFLQHVRAVRDDRNHKIIARLHALGIEIEMEEVAANAGGNCIGRPHFANVLVEKGIVQEKKEAFTEYLGSSGKAYVPKAPIEPADACKALSRAGATVIMAHPLLNNPDVAWLDKKVNELAGHGLDGLEVWHTEKNKGNERLLQKMARQHNLAVSGGTDYHGKNKAGIVLGKGAGNLSIPFRVYEDLCAFRKNRKLPC